MMVWKNNWNIVDQIKYEKIAMQLTHGIASQYHCKCALVYNVYRKIF